MTPDETLSLTRARLTPWQDRLGPGPVPDRLTPLPAGVGADRLRLVLELRPRVAGFHLGAPVPAALHALHALRDAGIRVIGTATPVAEARALQAAGLDGVIAQGHEAGGHRGAHRQTAPGDGVGTMALVPQVVDAVTLPVMAAGGIGDGRGIAVALALGTAGVQMGTAFLLCPETDSPAARRAALRRSCDTATMMSDAFSGRPARTRRSAHALEMARSGDALPAFPTLFALGGPLIAAGQAGDASFNLWGQASGLSRKVAAGQPIAVPVRQTEAARDCGPVGQGRQQGQTPCCRLRHQTCNCFAVSTLSPTSFQSKVTATPSIG